MSYSDDNHNISQIRKMTTTDLLPITIAVRTIYLSNVSAWSSTTAFQAATLPARYQGKEKRAL